MGFNFSKIAQVHMEATTSAATLNDSESAGPSKVLNAEPDKTPPDLDSADEITDTELKNQRRDSFDKFQREILEKRQQRQKAMAGVKGELSTLRAQLAEKTNLSNQLLEFVKTNGLKVPDELMQPIISFTPTATLSVACQSEIPVMEVCDKATLTDCQVQEPEEKCEEPEVEVKEPSRNLRIELAVAHHDLQTANETILDLQIELKNTTTYAASLKDVITVSKQMVQVREDQLNELKSKLNDIESTLNQREAELMSTKLREEYMQQLEKMKNLRTLYEERARLSMVDRDNLRQELATSKEEHNLEIEKTKNLEERLQSLEASLQTSQEETLETKNQLSLSKADTRDLQAQISVINLLFSQIILGASASENGDRAPMMDFDKLIVILEEHRGLLNDITMEDDSYEGAAYFPKLLYDLVSQNDGEADVQEQAEGNEVVPRNIKISEIAEKLPKVWKVFIEFLSHQKENPMVVIPSEGGCEALETAPAAGSSSSTAVISVSKTFIKLKDLIVEKKELQKQTNRLKTLNTHLEKRLQSQEKRLGTVCVELSKTWNMVGRMQRQHRQLHTNEQVLRYQLFQKRRLLNELKEELEYCRRKWSAARQKNNDTEAQWRVLRTEITNRKLPAKPADIDDANQQSGESGYSGDEQLSDDDVLERKPKIVEAEATFLEDVVEVKDNLPEPEIRKTPRNKVESAEEMFMRLTGQPFIVEATVAPLLDEAAGTSASLRQPEEFVIEQDSEDIFDLEVPMPVLCSFSASNGSSPQAEASHSSTYQVLAKPKAVVMEDTEDEDSFSSEPAKTYKLTSTEEEYLDRRQRRLERLEKEAAEFHKRMSTNKERGSRMCTKLDDLHDRYSQSRKQRASDKKIAEENVLNGEEAQPSCSYRKPKPKPVKMDGTVKVLSDCEIKYTENRTLRIESLEEQCTDLLAKIRSTTSKGTEIAKQLDALHERSIERELKSRFGPAGRVYRHDNADPENTPLDRESSTDSCTVEGESNDDSQAIFDDSTIDEKVIAENIDESFTENDQDEQQYTTTNHNRCEESEPADENLNDNVNLGTELSCELNENPVPDEEEGNNIVSSELVTENEAEELSVTTPAEETSVEPAIRSEVLPVSNTLPPLEHIRTEDTDAER